MIERRQETVPVPRDLDCAAHIQIARDFSAALYVLLKEGAQSIEVRWVDTPEASNNPFCRGYAIVATRRRMYVEDELRACGM